MKLIHINHALAWYTWYKVNHLLGIDANSCKISTYAWIWLIILIITKCTVIFPSCANWPWFRIVKQKIFRVSTSFLNFGHLLDIEYISNFWNCLNDVRISFFIFVPLSTMFLKLLNYFCFIINYPEKIGAIFNGKLS